jgi:hypothetical protein
MAGIENPGALAGAAGAGNAFHATAVRIPKIAQGEADENLRVALELALQGLPVFPCGPDKRPLVRWKEVATCDPEVLRELWRQHPGALVGLPCGGRSGLFVVDLDTDRATGERTGEASLRAPGLGHLLHDARQPRVRTPSGGVHLLFRHPGPGFGNTAGKFGPKIDTRGDGGYIIAPGTAAPAGRYTPEGPIAWDALPPLPEALRAALAAPQRPEEPPSAPASGGPMPGGRRRWRANWRGFWPPRWGSGTRHSTGERSALRRPQRAGCWTRQRRRPAFGRRR